VLVGKPEDNKPVRQKAEVLQEDNIKDWKG
jgi:hypothetical protein